MIQLVVGVASAVFLVLAAVMRNMPFTRKDSLWNEIFSDDEESPREAAESDDEESPPEETEEDPKPEEKEPARKRYFFGPCYAQLFRTWRDALLAVCIAGFSINEIRSSVVDALTDNADSGGTESAWNNIVHIVSWLPFFPVAVVVSAAVGVTLALGLEAAFLAFCLPVTILFGAICLVVRISDELFIRMHKIRSDCPRHKGTFRIPAYECRCGRLHRRLKPNSYGIWYHRCECGERLPCTLALGRGRLQACCPVPGCGERLVASDARPIVFQLAGGSHAGKTVFLASTAHLVRERADQSAVELEIPDHYRALFDRLEVWYSGKEACEKTTEMRGQMYPMLLRPPEGVRRVLAFYDIGGERFRREDLQVEAERQMGYCDGLLLFLDPFSSGKLREEKEAQGELPARFSDERAEDVVNSFVNFLISLNAITVNERYPIPVSVLITKADEPEVFRSLSPERIEAAWQAQRDAAAEDEPQPTRAEVRDEVCRAFLEEQDLHTVLLHLDQSFRTLHFYPVSAMGHSDMEGRAYAPWGVEELMEDLLRQADPELYAYFDQEKARKGD